MSDKSDISDLISILENQMRRAILLYLRNKSNRQTDINEITEYLVNTAESDEKPIEKDQVILRLHHLHLPKLASADLIEYDPRSGTVRYLSDSRTEQLLDKIERK